MSLKLYYKENDAYIEVSSAGSFESPVATTHNGKTGDVTTEQLYIRNNNSALWYSNIIISSYDATRTPTKDDSDYESTGWGIKLSEGSEEPTEGVWENLLWNNRIEMDDIGSSASGDSTTYYPFWRLITCPPHTNIQIKKNIYIRVEYTENAVS
jgi:hypothetical protein